MDPGTAPATAGGRWIPALACALVAVVLALELHALRGVPFVSEDWTHMAEMRAVPAFSGSLDPSLEPLRPLQHAFFWILAHGGGDPTSSGMPLLAHAFAFLLHAVACACVYHLARAAGAPRIGALVATVLFVVFPNVKTLAWSAAIGSAGRVCFELLALILFARQAQDPKHARGALALASFVIALGFHESAMLLPVILALWILFMQGADVRAGLARLSAAARDPWIRALAIATVVYAIQLVLRSQRHHELKSMAALPANGVKAATSILPEIPRVAIVEGFRAPEHVIGFLLASVLFILLATGVVVLFRRSRIARFVLLACAVDLGLAVLGAGFVQRYAYLSSALIAVGLATWSARRPNLARLALGLTFLWTYDTVRDMGDLRSLEGLVNRTVQETLRRREQVGPGVPIAIVDPPDMVGNERDIPVFNWGLDFLLDAHSVEGPWLLWRTRPYATSTNVELVGEARVEEARRTGVPPLVEPALSRQR